MESVLPTYSKFVDLEKRTLVLLRNELCCKGKTLASVVNDVEKALWSEDKRVFSFCTHWDVAYMDTECRIFLGAGVERSSREDKICRTSYYVCIAQGTDCPKMILRKFHFDYVTEDKMHPRFHLQYGGELPPAMELRGVTKDHIDRLLPKVREPRIFFAPVTIGLLMNTMFYEFPTDDTNAAKKEPAWRRIIWENEKEVLKPFYSKCADLAGKCDAILFDQVYVK